MYAMVWANPDEPLKSFVIKPVLALERKDDKQNFPWPFLTSGGLFMFCSHETLGTGNGRLMLWRRKSLDKPFREGVYLSIPGQGYLFGRSPRYCEATKELFFYGTESVGTADRSTQNPWTSLCSRGST